MIKIFYIILFLLGNYISYIGLSSLVLLQHYPHHKLTTEREVETALRSKLSTVNGYFIYLLLLEFFLAYIIL